MESQFSFLFLQLSTVTENKYLFKMNIQSVHQLETQYFHLFRMKSFFPVFEESFKLLRKGRWLGVTRV